MHVEFVEILSKARDKSRGGLHVHDSLARCRKKYENQIWKLAFFVRAREWAYFKMHERKKIFVLSLQTSRKYLYFNFLPNAWKYFFFKTAVLGTFTHGVFPSLKCSHSGSLPRVFPRVMNMIMLGVLHTPNTSALTRLHVSRSICSPLKRISGALFGAVFSLFRCVWRVVFGMN